MVAGNLSLFLDTSIAGLKDNVLYDNAQPVAVVSFYLLFVLNLGPKFMKNRNPFGLKKVLMVFNLAQIVFNAALFFMTIRLLPYFSPFCSPPNVSNTPVDISMRNIHYYYMLLKFSDLLDTVFFVLRKKDNQITFLHLHHHSVMALTAWVTLKHIPGGIGFYLFLWNTLVHAVMYVYYLLTSFGAARVVWWKKHLTQFQLVQHFSLLPILLIHLFNSSCTYSKSWLVYYLLNGLLTIALFLKFYWKQYKKDVKKSA